MYQSMVVGFPLDIICLQSGGSVLWQGPSELSRAVRSSPFSPVLGVFLAAALKLGVTQFALSNERKDRHFCRRLRRAIAGIILLL